MLLPKRDGNYQCTLEEVVLYYLMIRAVSYLTPIRGTGYAGPKNYRKHDVMTTQRNLRAANVIL